jgi:hypothetical protein
MAVIFNPATATIAGSMQTAVPDVDIRTDKIVCNLTQNYDKTTGDPTGTAFTATGHVGVSGSLAGWDFGFIQFAQAKFLGVFYAGRIRSEGSIGILAHIPPALPKAVLLDSDDNHTPWTRTDPRFNSSGSAVHATTGDHPALRVALERRNSNRNAPNFLFHVVDKREMVTIFTANDPQNKNHYLAHFEWTLVYDFKFSWRGGKPVMVANQSSIPQGAIQSIKGPPTASEWQALLTNPTGPQFNDESRKALFQARNGPRGPNRSENPSWFNNVPVDFFQ